MSPSLTGQAREALKRGDPAEAMDLARRATAAGDHAGHAVLAQTLRQTGELVEAERHARLALEHDPEDVVTRAYLGAILVGLGRSSEGLDAYRTAADAQPDNAVLQNELGNALATTGDLEQAETILRRAVALRGDIPEIHNNLGNVLRGLGHLEEAANCYQMALRLRPAYPEALNNAGIVMQVLGDVDGAIAAYRRSIALRPDNAYVHTHLGTAYSAKGQLSDAVDAHRTALRYDASLMAAHNHLGIALKDQGLLGEARASYEKALALNPNDPGIHSNFLMCHSYDPEIDGERLFLAHRKWAARHERPRSIPPKAEPDSDRVLRVGYVSPDFWTHSVAYFIEPVLAQHDRSRIHVTCYADVERPDETTERLKGLADRWRETLTMDDDALLQTIGEDEIDILVDLTGHTANNRLPVFGRRAAPVQMSWIGYPATTGLSQMDYRITDGWADPMDQTDRYHSELLIRLHEGFLAYRPPDGYPEPADRSPDRPLTFGSFNNLSKMTDEVIALWAKLLQAKSSAKLLLKSRQLADAGVRDRVTRAFGEHGIDAARLDLRERVASPHGHLSLYNSIDVALDTFPYNGTTTTCEALWMGVPVVTLAGALHAGRVGVSLLNQVGRKEWIAESPGDYMSIALAVAADLPDRAALREQVANSKLMDAEGLTRTLEDVMREVWRRHCEDASQAI